MALAIRLTWVWTLFALLYACTVLASNTSTPHRRSRLRSTTHSRNEVTNLDKRAAPNGWSIYTKSGNDGGGCYVDSSAARILTGYTMADSKNGLQSCLTTCANKGFTYAGVQYGTQCYVSRFPQQTVNPQADKSVRKLPPLYPHICPLERMQLAMQDCQYRQVRRDLEDERLHLGYHSIGRPGRIHSAGMRSRWLRQGSDGLYVHQ